MTAAPAVGAAPRAEAVLLGIAKTRKRREPTFRERLFARWLASAAPGELFCYHRGELGRDAAEDPDLAAMAARAREAACGVFAEISSCGHERGKVIGAGLVELTTRRDRGETVYLARKRA